MNSPYREIIGVLLILFGVYWLFTSSSIKSTKRTEPYLSSLFHSCLLLFGFALIWIKWFQIGILEIRIIPENILFQVIGVIFVTTGVLFAIWARRVLGEEWSNNVAIKDSHMLIKIGPYQFVRNPIYTGVIFAMLGMMITLGEIRGLIGLILVFISVWHKGWMEEQFLVEEFGDEYIEYKKNVKFMIPFVY